MDKNDYVEKLCERVHACFDSKLWPADLIDRFPKIAVPWDTNLTYEELYTYPGLQEAFAFIVHYTPSKWLLEQEASFVNKLRDLHDRGGKDDFFRQGSAPAGCLQPDSDDIYDWAKRMQLTGLCLSGGGIRSATFNLGVLQGLALKGWLNQFDYLSSVSGGGYIHSWLVAWFKRKTLDETGAHQPPLSAADAQRSAFKQVTYRLRPLPDRTDDPKYQTAWPRQIQWLRRYSNYLTPRVGLLTADTWSAIAMWIRNVSLNQALLVMSFLAILCLPHLLAPGVRLTEQSLVSCHAEGVAGAGSQKQEANACKDAVAKLAPPARTERLFYFRCVFLEYGSARWNWSGFASFASKLRNVAGTTVWALLSFVAGTLLIGYLLRMEYDRGRPPGEARLNLARFPVMRNRQVLIANIMLGFLLIFSVLMTFAIYEHRENAAFPIALFLLLLSLVWMETFAGGALGQVLSKLDLKLEREGKSEKLHTSSVVWNVLRLTLLGLPAAIIGAAAGAAIAAFLRSWILPSMAARLGLDRADSLQIVVGTLLFFWLAPVTMIIASGFIGKDFPDWLSEWLGRIRAYSLLIGIGWTAVCGSALLMPALLLQIHHHTGGRIQWPALGTWLATTAISVLGGKSSKTSGNPNPSSGSKLLEELILIGPYVYISGLIFCLSLGLEKLHGPLADHHFFRSDRCLWAVSFVVLAILVVLLGRRLDINQFSMFTLYRNRLTRCYLGASNITRSPSPVTGFDEKDTQHLQIAHLTVDHKYPGPIPLFCCAMNITVGEDLAWQERKAASFAFTPFYSGYTVGWTEGKKNLRFNGFVPTKYLYEGDPTHGKSVGGPNIATAMAASGAAVSPNWGYHTKPAMAFLMTMFDVRLGLWTPNPRHSPLAGQKLESERETPIQPASPAFAPWWLTSELLGSVDDTSKYVYITDGGHFDNMGLYELVRRRCYRIVVCDAEGDDRSTFEGIGNAIRKCRIDFGAEIDLNLSPLLPGATNRLSPAHIARGTIRYPETKADELGEILYIKSSLTAWPPLATPNGETMVDGLPHVAGDVQSYKLLHPQFPQDSTAEQWFTESQFESYRSLGQRIVDELPILFP